MKGNELGMIWEWGMGKREAKEKRCFLRCAESILYVVEW